MYTGEEDWAYVDLAEYCFEEERLRHGHDESILCTENNCKVYLSRDWKQAPKDYNYEARMENSN